MSLKTQLVAKLSQWLSVEHDPHSIPLSDQRRLAIEIRPCDVILVEGRSRVSDVIKTITHSVWTHAVLYIGRLVEIDDPELRKTIETHYHGPPNEQLIIEALLGEGTVVHPLSKYKNDHLRLCRPRGLSPDDMTKIIHYAASQLGNAYDIRQLFDLARFFLPYGILPRRWRSSLFQHYVGTNTRTVCSTMIAEAFSHVHFPIIPIIQKTEEGILRLFRRNTRLYTPRDFDYSPYFDIIKYPFFGFDNLAAYRNLPWNQDGVICNDENDCYIPQTDGSLITTNHGKKNNGKEKKQARFKNREDVDPFKQKSGG